MHNNMDIESIRPKFIDLSFHLLSNSRTQPQEVPGWSNQSNYSIIIFSLLLSSEIEPLPQS